MAILLALSLTGLVPATPSGASAPRAINLTASAEVKATLLLTFERVRHIPASAISGFDPAGLWYAYDVTTKTYWALGTMEPSSHVSERAAVELQDAGRFPIFRRLPGHHWMMDGLIGEPYCDAYTHSIIPDVVRALWFICGT